MTDKKYLHHPEIHRTQDAEHLVPLIIEMFRPQSVIDVGCGPGTFLKVFVDSGVDDVLGVEGSWLDTSRLLVDKDRIVIADITDGFSVDRRFDIALCLEVAEHLDERHAPVLIDTLASLSDVIIFSAAIPYQGGQNHVNEQWPAYWQELFRKKGYSMLDAIRMRIWDAKEIYWWYRQNIFVCIKDGQEAGEVKKIIHPELYIAKVAELQAYRQWVDKIFSGEIEVEIAESILEKAKKLHGK